MLKVENLTIRFEDREAGQEVVKGISFSVKEGEILGIVGESGSGKTMTALTVMGLLKKHAFLDSGNIYLENLDLLQLNEKQMRTVQGNDISMIFQEPMTSLNPTMKIGRQVEEALKLHTNMSKKERQESDHSSLSSFIPGEQNSRRYSASSIPRFSLVLILLFSYRACAPFVQTNARINRILNIFKFLFLNPISSLFYYPMHYFIAFRTSSRYL